MQYIFLHPQIMLMFNINHHKRRLLKKDFEIYIWLDLNKNKAKDILQMYVHLYIHYITQFFSDTNQSSYIRLMIYIYIYIG